jgi:chromosome segregation ATPase
MVVASIDDDALEAGIEALRSRTGRKGGGPPMRRPGSGKVLGLKKAASTAALICAKPDVSMAAADSSHLHQVAVDSVQAGLIASLDRDCRAYRAEIMALQKRLLENEAGQSSDRELALQKRLDAVQEELEAARRDREAMLATVARLKREKGTPMEQLALAEEQIAKERAECEKLRLENAESARQLAEERRAAASAAAAAESAAEAQQCELSRLESCLSEASRAAVQHANVEEGLRAEVAKSKEAADAARTQVTQLEEEIALAKAAAAQSSLEAFEAKGESSAYARRLKGMAERRDEQERRGELDEQKKKAEASTAVNGLRGELTGLRAENSRANELVRTLRAKLVEATKASSAPNPEQEQAAKAKEQEVARARKAAEKHEKRAAQLEAAKSEVQAANVELQAELSRARAAAEEALADADAAKARVEMMLRSAPAVRDAPREQLAPVAANEKARGPSNFGKFQTRVKALEAENATLKAQLEQRASHIAITASPALRR